jgi:hypothetical protein
MRCLMASSRLHTRCAAGLCSPGRRVTCVAPALGRKMGHIERAAFSPRRAVVDGRRATHTNEQSRVTVTRSRAPHARARATRHRSYISPHPVVSTTPPTVAAHIMASHQQQHNSVVAPSLMAVQPSALRSVPKATPCKA